MRVGQLISKERKRKNNPSYNEEQIKYSRRYRKRHKDEIKLRKIKFRRELTLFKNKRCGLCNKLIGYKSKTNCCFECYRSNPQLLKMKRKKIKRTETDKEIIIEGNLELTGDFKTEKNLIVKGNILGKDGE
jgi:hypothetical protein